MSVHIQRDYVEGRVRYRLDLKDFIFYVRATIAGNWSLFVHGELTA